jgi:glycosyltransferase involved in cell wall biosynthesis
MVQIVENPLHITSILFWVFIFSSFVLLLFYWLIFSRAAFRKVKFTDSSQKKPPVSVIICARNEYENLKNNLPLVLEQDYPEFEVILVNDFSEDDSYFLIKSFQEKYPHFKVINLRENVNFFAGKKLALAVGIKSANYKIVLLTDADCMPAGNKWIETMSSGFDGKTNVVLGYGGYKKTPGILNALIRFDTVNIAMQFMGFALAGKPYMGVGRNLAYIKDLFFKTGGFASHYKINSGDDDLFINQAAKGKNTKVIIDQDGFTYSDPKRTFSAWFKQKKRHMSTSKFYKFSDKFFLGLLGLSHTLFYASFIVLLILIQNPEVLLTILAVLVLKIISFLVLHYYAGKKYKEPKLFLYSPLFDFIFALLNPIFAISNLFYRKNKWK